MEGLTSSSQQQLSTPLLSRDDEFLEFEKDEEEGNEAAGGDGQVPEHQSSSQRQEQGGGGGAAGFWTSRRSRRRRGGNDESGTGAARDLLLPTPNDDTDEAVVAGDAGPMQEVTADGIDPPSSQSAGASCRRFNSSSAAVSASLILLWVLAAAFVGYQSSLKSGGGGSDDDPSSNHNAFPALTLTTELAKLSWLVYRFRNVDDPDTVCSMVETNYSHILDPTNMSPWDDTNNITSGGSSSLSSSTLHCHWYFHDRTQGTQVLLVSTTEYLAIVFSGTDDVQTSLTDVDLFTAEPTYFNSTPEYDSRIRIHSGFHQAVFAEGILSNVTTQLQAAIQDRHGKVPWYKRWRRQNRKNAGPGRLYLTGHSLGGANAILTALALQANSSSSSTSDLAASTNDVWDGLTIQSISFGCPRIGNLYWRDFANQLSTRTLGPVVRVVLGWDLVPRLPEFLLHVGHTFQLSKSHSWIRDEEGPDVDAELNLNGTAGSEKTVSSSSYTPAVWNTSVYYQHYGDPSHGYAGVPLGWSATPFLWVPGALSSHSIRRYVSTLANMTESQWSNDFVHTPSPIPTPDDPKNHSTPSNFTVDDDFYAEPPRLDHPEDNTYKLSSQELDEVQAEFAEMIVDDDDDDHREKTGLDVQRKEVLIGFIRLMRFGIEFGDEINACC